MSHSLVLGPRQGDVFRYGTVGIRDSRLFRHVEFETGRRLRRSKKLMVWGFEITE